MKIQVSCCCAVINLCDNPRVTCVTQSVLYSKDNNMVNHLFGRLQSFVILLVFIAVIFQHEISSQTLYVECSALKSVFQCIDAEGCEWFPDPSGGVGAGRCVEYP